MNNDINIRIKRGTIFMLILAVILTILTQWAKTNPEVERFCSLIGCDCDVYFGVSTFPFPR